MSLRIHGGMVVTPKGLEVTDVLVDDGLVVAIGEAIGGVGPTLDASGCLVGPGLVDIHTHLRDPGHTWKEDLISGTRAAAAGGFTAVIMMPNTEPPIDNAGLAGELLARARDVSLIEVHAAGALTRGRSGSEPSDLAGMYEMGVRVFTDDGDCVEDPDLAERLMRLIAAMPGGVFAQHAELSRLTRGGHMHHGPISEKLGVGGMPAAAETEVVARDIGLVAMTGARYHCQHISAAGTVDVIREAKARNLPVTAEVTPHHLTFTDSDVSSLDPNLKMYPPVRGEEDRSALRSALLDGTIDVVATDHAPHSHTEKSAAFTEAPRGVTGLETAASVTWEATGDPKRFFDALASGPARIAGLPSQGHPVAPGSPANLVIFDPDARWVPGQFFSKSSNSPYLGLELTGRVVATIARGRMIHQLETDRV